jgi:hypothetical protein
MASLRRTAAPGRPGGAALRVRDPRHAQRVIGYVLWALFAAILLGFGLQ